MPIPFAYTFDPTRLDFNFPLVGTIPAIISLGVYCLVRLVSPAGTLSAILAVAVQYLALNLFHLDGLMDTADAFLGKASREKRLEILKDSRFGVYGFFAGFVAVSVKIALLWELGQSALPLGAATLGEATLGLAALGEAALGEITLIFAYPITGRACAALIPALTAPQGETGLGALVRGSQAWRVAAGTALALFYWAALISGFALAFQRHPFPLTVRSLRSALLLLGIIACCASGFSAALSRTYKAGIGGYTGDALGAAVELGELWHLGACLIALRCFPPAWR